MGVTTAGPRLSAVVTTHHRPLLRQTSFKPEGLESPSMRCTPDKLKVVHFPRQAGYLTLRTRQGGWIGEAMRMGLEAHPKSLSLTMGGLVGSWPAGTSTTFSNLMSRFAIPSLWRTKRHILYSCHGVALDHLFTGLVQE